jgi:hypothetical protein
MYFDKLKFVQGKATFLTSEVRIENRRMD